MRYTPLPPDTPPDPRQRRPHSPSFKALQPYDALLILDVEATCFQGTDFNYPNEIIEFPICLMKWQDRDRTMKASKLQVVDEFRSFVRPSWRPTLSGFCTELTGITQDQVDAAPSFPDVLKSVRTFLVKNGLIDDATGKRRVRFCWCSDGPFDIRDFVVKQCFISKISMPEWLTGDVLDVRMAVMQWLNTQPPHSSNPNSSTRAFFPPVRRSLNIPAQLKALGLPTFQGRQHSGIDDTRNIAKIATELGKRGVSLKPNTQIKPGRKWVWMGKGGEVLEQFCMNFDDRGNLATLPASPSLSASTCASTEPATPQLGSKSSLSTVVGAGSQVHGSGTATRPASPAFWSPPRTRTSSGLNISRPASPMSLISSSPDNESGFEVMIAGAAFSPGTPTPTSGRSRRGHKRHVNALGVSAVSGVAIGATAACVS